MSDLPRINPRRPYIITSLGRRRYTLGQANIAGAGAGLPAEGAVPHGTAASGKPARLRQAATHCIMAVAHTERGLLTQGAQQALAAAALLADDQCAAMLVVFGNLDEDAAPYGADQVIVLADAAGFNPDQHLQMLAQLRDQHHPDHIILADTDLPDADLGRRLAVSRNLSIAPHVVELTADSATVYRRQGTSYARRDLPDVILLDGDCVDTRLPFTGLGERLNWAPTGLAPSRYTDHGTTAVPAAHLSLEEADFIVSAGNGVHDLDGFRRLAEAFGAGIGASRVAVDDGRFTRDQQVGATGKTVSSSVYIAVGISGAVQHLQGIKDCRHVIAINTDSSAPMIKRADLSLIDDAHTMIHALLDAVDAARGQAREAA
jgi:electron transfer flavoprotein alpha subunit